jgi:signal transduction histidine kinase
VTETIRTVNASSGESGPRTELGTIQDLAFAVWRRLFADAFALRPLPPLPLGIPALRRLPGPVRLALRRLPHAAVAVLAIGLFGFSWQIYGTSTDRGNTPAGVLLIGSAAALPLLLLLFRPLAAWWLSVALTFVAAGYCWTDPWPWSEIAFTSNLVIMVVVAVRSPLGTAVGMWVVSTAAGAVASSISDWGLGGSNVVVFAAWSALALTLAALLRGWTSARREVVAKDELTVIERSKRTVLEERTTIARELHDVVAHHMSVIAIQAEAAPYRVENPPVELTRSFTVIRENAVAALGELRRILGVIRVSDYEAYDAPEAPQPTLDALDGLLANAREAGLPLETVTTGARRELPQGVELSAYRIIQEALSNTLRHAPGAATRVELAYVLGGLGVRVVNGPVIADEVPGPSPVRERRGGGHGIAGMRERVTMLGGEITAGPAADGGYEIAAFLPASTAVEREGV